LEVEGVDLPDTRSVYTERAKFRAETRKAVAVLAAKGVVIGEDLQKFLAEE